MQYLIAALLLTITAIFLFSERGILSWYKQNRKLQEKEEDSKEKEEPDETCPTCDSTVRFVKKYNSMIFAA